MYLLNIKNAGIIEITAFYIILNQSRITYSKRFYQIINIAPLKGQLKMIAGVGSCKFILAAVTDRRSGQYISSVMTVIDPFQPTVPNATSYQLLSQLFSLFAFMPSFQFLQVYHFWGSIIS